MNFVLQNQDARAEAEEMSAEGAVYDESQYQMVVGIDNPSDDDIPDLLSDGYHSDSDSEDGMPALMSCGSGIEVDSKGPARAGVSNDGSSLADSDDVPDLISSDTDSEDEEVAARCRRQLRQTCAGRLNTVLRMPVSFVRTGIVPTSRFADADMLARAAAAAVEAGRLAPVAE